ncbi:MAG TPA: hypothetical protein VL147_02590, partial [Devosia sp.]|nr:hypothetical protein [Devosia sp.]
MLHQTSELSVKGKPQQQHQWPQTGAGTESDHVTALFLASGPRHNQTETTEHWVIAGLLETFEATE